MKAPITLNQHTIPDVARYMAEELSLCSFLKIRDTRCPLIVHVLFLEGQVDPVPQTQSNSSHS